MRRLTAISYAFAMFLMTGMVSAETVAVYTNQAAWQAAAGVGGLTSVSLDPALWTQTEGLYLGQIETPDVVETTTLKNGQVFSVTGIERFGLEDAHFSFTDNSLDTHLDLNVTDDWSFSQPIYGFGAYFTAAGPESQGASAEDGIPNIDVDIHTGFVGITSTEPISSEIYFAANECVPFGGVCGTSFKITDLQLEFVPSPEPGYLPIFCALGVVLFVAHKHR